jgi:hypothetical protein
MAAKTILLKGDPLQKQAKATAVAITPGYLLQLDSVAGQVEAHATAGGRAAKLFAIENALQGKEISDNYAISEQIQYVSCRPGDEINAMLQDGQNVARGDFVESNGDGTLRKVVDVDAATSASAVIQTSNIVGVVLEALDISNSANVADARVKIEVM